MGIIELILFGCLFIWGVHVSLKPDMIFGRFGNKLALLPKPIRKPLGTCVLCMPSVYGTLFFTVFYFCGYIDYSFPLVLYICYIFALTGLNYIIKNLIYVDFIQEKT